MVCLSISNKNDMKLERTIHAMCSKPLESAVQYLLVSIFPVLYVKNSELQHIAEHDMKPEPTRKVGCDLAVYPFEAYRQAIPKKKNPADLSFHARG